MNGIKRAAFALSGSREGSLDARGKCVGSLWAVAPAVASPSQKEGLNGAVQHRCVDGCTRSETSPLCGPRPQRWARLGVWEAPVSLVLGHVPEEGSGMKVNQLQLP